MTISLPRYSKDSPVDLVDGAYGAAMGQIENELSNVSTAVTKSEQALSTAEQAKTSVLQQQEEIDRIRGDLVTVNSNNHSHDVNSGGAHSHTLSINSAGSSGTGKNMPAYMAVNMWQRVS